MSRPAEGRRKRAGVRRVWGVLLAGLLAPAALAGQTAEELVQRLDSLRPLLEQARHDAERAELEAKLRAQAQLGIRLDTLQVGPLRIVTPEEQAPAARRAFEEAWETVAPFAGDATHVLDDGIWLFQHAPRFERIRLPLTPDDVKVHDLRVRSWRPWERVVRNVEGSLWRRLASAVPGDVGVVIRGGPWQPKGDEFLEIAYRGLVTAAGRPSRACVRGDLAACWTAVGADGVAERWDEWYGPAERRRVVLESSPSGSAQGSRHRACAEGSQAACDLFLEESGPPEVPVRGMARAGLVGYALDLGGEGSYGRLLEAAGAGLREAVSAASGLDADEVMRRWRARVLEHRPATGADLGRSRWSTLVWIVVLGTLAMGSTRWRLD